MEISSDTDTESSDAFQGSRSNQGSHTTDKRDQKSGSNSHSRSNSNLDSQETRGESGSNSHSRVGKPSDEKYPSEGSRPSSSSVTEKSNPSAYTHNSSEKHSYGSSERNKSISQLAKKASRKNLPADTDVVAYKPPPLLGKSLGEKEILRAFNQIDDDSNTFIGSEDLRKVFRSVRMNPTDLEIAKMIQIVDIDGDGQISMSEFRQFVYTKLLGVSEEHYSTVPVPASMAVVTPFEKRVFRTIKGARRADIGKLGTIQIAKEDEGKKNVLITNDMEMDAKRSRRELVSRYHGIPCTSHPRAEIARLRNVIFGFNQQMDLNLFILEQSYYKAIHYMKDDLAMITFSQFIKIFEVRESCMDAARVLFDTFKCGKGKTAPAYMITMALAALLRATNLKKTNFFFLICDAKQSGRVHKDDVADMLSATHLSHKLADYKNKLVVLMGDRNAQWVSKTAFVKSILRLSSVLFPAVRMKQV